MNYTRTLADKLAGGILMFIGIISLIEARKLSQMRQGMFQGMFGDDTFPFVLGIVLLILGGLLAFVVKSPRIKVDLPQGTVRKKMILGFSSMVGYCAIMPYLGYTASTFLGSVALFKVIGSYRWHICVLYGAIVTAVFYLIFIRWLMMPIPVGFWGI